MKYKNIMILLAAFAMTATGCSDFWRENRWLKAQKQSFFRMQSNLNKLLMNSITTWMVGKTRIMQALDLTKGWIFPVWDKRWCQCTGR